MTLFYSRQHLQVEKRTQESLLEHFKQKFILINEEEPIYLYPILFIKFLARPFTLRLSNHTITIYIF